MPVLPKVIFFDSEKAAEGDEVVFILNTNGQIEKCSIPGKEAEPVKKPVGAGGDRDRKPRYGTAGGRSYDGQAFGNRKNYGGSRIAGSGHSVAQNPALCDARAPYNFIPYEPKAVLTEENSEYGVWSGILHCSLEAVTPLLVAGERIQRADESTECHFFQVEGKHVIPGSSIKGVLRSMVEILSFPPCVRSHARNSSGVL